MPNTYKFTEHAQPPGYDHVIVRANGEFIGFRGLDETAICLQKCPECKKSNWSPAVTSGICAWCGFNVNA